MTNNAFVTRQLVTSIDALKDNVREAIGEIQLQRIDNVLKNFADRVAWPAKAVIWMKLFSIIKRILPYLQMKKEIWENIQQFFF